MPQTTVDIDARIEDDTTHIKVTRGNDVVSSKLKTAKIPDVLSAVEWIANRRHFKTITTPTIQKRVTFTFHTVNAPDGDYVVVDSVDNVENLPKDQGKLDFQNLTGWKTWTAQQAVDWIESNVTDLASAKVVLQQMARAIIALRNINVDGG